MEEPRVRRWDVAFSVFTSLLGSAGILMVVVPKFKEVFLQVKVPMPGMTLWVMSLSDLAWACPILTAFVMTAMTASVHAWNGRAIAIARRATPVLTAVFWGAMVYALMLPLLGCHLTIGPRRY